MRAPHVLVVHFSRTGHTRAVSEALAAALGADMEEIRDRADRRGVLGYLRSATESLLGSSTQIELPQRDPSAYDLVVVGGPVWAASVCAPVRTYLWLARERLPAVALFVTYGGAGAERALSRMARIAGKRPVATLAVREADVARGRHGARAETFAAALLERLARRRARARVA